MSEKSGSGAGEFDVKDLVLSIGWHLAQGEQLSASYARTAADAGYDQWAEFFKGMEQTFRDARRVGGQQTLASFGGDEDVAAWWRPPYWG